MPTGSGRIVSDSRTVEDFAGIEVNSGLLAEVTVAPGAAFAVTIVGDDNLVDYVKAEVASGVLTVRLPDATTNPNSPDHLRVAITAPTVTSIEADGAANVTARGLAADALTLTASGAALLTAFGESSHVDAEASGSGRIEARKLTAHDVVARGDGGGELAVCADDHLDLHLSGGSHARFACSPQHVSRDITGGSSAEAE